ncbi:MAG TPA: hypothetical protein VGM78_10165, partial [Ilumatobacteraceae bacterium]
AVHGFAGVWGTWSVGLFATGHGVSKGLFWGGGSLGAKFFLAQVWGNAVIAIAAFGIAFFLMHAVKLTGTLRVSEEGELEGIDIHEHGAPAYHPEAAYMGKGI